MNALVTGGAGFVGRHLVAALKHEGHDVLVIDPTTSGDTFQRFRYWEPYDTIFHLAAHHYIPWVNEHPRETFELNALAFANMLADIPGTPTVILASSAAVYGFGPHHMSEHQFRNPVDMYGLSKVAAEMALRSWAEERGAVGIAARLFNVVGVGDSWPHLVPRIAKAVADGERPIKVGNVWPMRDYVHVTDVADALVRLADAPPGARAYNVCTGTGVTIAEVLDLFDAEDVISETGRKVDGHLIGCPDKMTRDYGWTARRSIDHAVAELRGASVT